MKKVRNSACKFDAMLSQRSIFFSNLVNIDWIHFDMLGRRDVDKFSFKYEMSVSDSSKI